MQKDEENKKEIPNKFELFCFCFFDFVFIFFSAFYEDAEEDEKRFPPQMDNNFFLCPSFSFFFEEGNT